MVIWCGHEELCINHSSLQLSVSSHPAHAHWEWGDVSSSHTSRCRELSPPTALGTLIMCSCWTGKLHYSAPETVLTIIRTAVWIVQPGSCFLTEQCLVSNVMVDGCVSGMRPVSSVAVCGGCCWLLNLTKYLCGGGGVLVEGWATFLSWLHN